MITADHAALSPDRFDEKAREIVHEFHRELDVWQEDNDYDPASRPVNLVTRFAQALRDVDREAREHAEPTAPAERDNLRGLLLDIETHIKGNGHSGDWSGCYDCGMVQRITAALKDREPTSPEPAP